LAFGGQLVLALDVAMGLPGRVVDLAGHELLFLHFIQDGIDLLRVHEFVNGLFVFRDAAVDEVQAFGD
jgi:hypothetical protein